MRFIWASQYDIHILASMNKKLTVGGEVADKQYLLRTTEDIYFTLAEQASIKGVSVNVIMNKALLSEAKKIKSSKSKTK